MFFLVASNFSVNNNVSLQWLNDYESTCNVEDLNSIPGLGRSPGGGHGNLLQYSCLYDPMDIGAWGLQSMGSPRVGHDWSN